MRRKLSRIDKIVFGYLDAIQKLKRVRKEIKNSEAKKDLKKIEKKLKKKVKSRQKKFIQLLKERGYSKKDITKMLKLAR